MAEMPSNQFLIPFVLGSKYVSIPNFTEMSQILRFVHLTPRIHRQTSERQTGRSGDSDSENHSASIGRIISGSILSLNIPSTTSDVGCNH